MIRDKEQLDRYTAIATAAGIRVMIRSRRPGPGRRRARRARPHAFVRFTTQVARAYPQVKDIGVGNELNQAQVLAAPVLEPPARRHLRRS